MSKSKGCDSSPPSLPDRIRSSLVLKLNMRMFWQLLSVFFIGNLLISFLFIGITLCKAELGACDIISMGQLQSDIADGNTVAMGPYRLEHIPVVSQGFRLPKLLQIWLPLGMADVRRSIMIPSASGKESLVQRIEQAEYRMFMDLNGLKYRVSYALKTDARMYRIILLVVILLQILYVISATRRNTDSIRKTLRPLSDLAETAKNLREGMSPSTGAVVSDSDIKDLTGAISTIDANQLTRRIRVNDSQDELKGLAYAINDMLDRISQSYESQVRFVSDASHELRTPISVIQGYANLLDRWGKHDERTMQEAIDAIRTETDSMKLLVEQLLFLARGDNETIQLYRSVFDICGLVDEIAKETCLIDLAHEFKICLDDKVYVDGDRQLIKQALRILLDNAIKYTPAGEKIILKVLTKEDLVHIRIQDNGIGIAPEDVPHIFDRFYRSDESRARKTGGSGLGLAIARWIVERHGGYFEVISRVNIGTRITVILHKTTPPVNDPKECGDNTNPV
jgi:two-component system sensor histidine kinase ArlS